MFHGIKAKFTLAIVAAVFGTATALTIITSGIVSYTLDISLKERAQETSKVIFEALSGRQRELSIRTDIDAQASEFQTAFTFRGEEVERLQKELIERTERAGANLSFVSEIDGKPVTSAELGKFGKGTSLAKSEALEQATKKNQLTVTIEPIEGKTFYVAAAPIKRYGEQTLGFLVYASAIDEAALKRLKEASGFDIIIVHQGAVQSATLSFDGKPDFAALDRSLDKKEVRTVAGLRAGGAPLLATALLLHAGDKQIALVFALSAKDAIALRNKVLLSSTGLALLIMTLTGLLGYLIARRISDPVVEIAQSFREIAASGDLSRRITKNYLDEVGVMAGSFNLMQEQIEGLHSRVVAAEQRMSGELKMASAVQELLVPTTTVDGARCQFVSHLETSSETGGDWFTIIHAPENHLTTVIIVDVTGHGAASALVTAIIHGFFRAMEHDLSTLSADNWKVVIESILLRLNKAMIESTKRALTCSLLLVTFDHRTCKMRYMNAGHLPPVVVRQVNGVSQVQMIAIPPSSLMGDSDTPEYAAGEIQLQPEQFFLVYTDGLVECTNASNEQYGLKRLRRVLSEVVPQQDARTVRDAVLGDAYKFFADTPRDDDITLVLGRVR